MSTRLRTLLLAGLLVLFVVIRLYVGFNDGGLSRDLFLGGGMDLEASLTPVQQRKLELLKAAPKLSFQAGEAYTDTIKDNRRNPFIFGLDPELEQRKRDQMAELQQQAAPPPEPVVVTAPEPVAPVFDGKVLGIFEDPKTRLKQVVVSLDEEVFVLREGAMLAGKYKVLKVGYKDILLQDLRDQKEIRIQVEAD